jgi:hypothetical protein
MNSVALTQDFFRKFMQTVIIISSMCACLHDVFCNRFLCFWWIMKSILGILHLHRTFGSMEVILFPFLFPLSMLPNPRFLIDLLCCFLLRWLIVLFRNCRNQISVFIFSLQNRNHKFVKFFKSMYGV